MNLRHHFLLCCIVFLGWGMSGCGPDKPVIPPATGTLEMNFQWKINGGEAEMATRYQISGNRFFTTDSFRFYISDIRFIKTDGTEILKNEVFLMDFDKIGKANHGEGIFESLQVEVGNYKGIQFKIGLPAETNHANPAQLPNDSPLHPNQKMHLNISDGYVFVALKGTADDGNGNSQTVSYKIASDSLLQTKTYQLGTDAFSIKQNQETQVITQIEMSEIFHEIDALLQNRTATFPYNSADYQLAKKLMSNFAVRSFYKLPQ